MSYSSVLQVGSNGDLGANKTATAFAPVVLASGVPSVVSNTISLEQGVWSLGKTLTFTTNGDGTTEIDSLVLTMTNEVGFIQTQTLIANGATAGVYASNAFNFVRSDIALCPNLNSNEFTASLTWVGAGSAPSASVQLQATKLV
jgi:hypothetical protein